MMGVIRVSLDLSDEDEVFLVSQAILHGYKRVEPKHRWTKVEHKECVRFMVKQMVEKFLKTVTVRS